MLGRELALLLIMQNSKHHSIWHILQHYIIRVFHHYCLNLASITIPDSVTRIVDYAFYGCTSLTSITIGDSVTSIGDMAFFGCHKLVEVTDNSSLNIEAGSGDYGYVGYYAIEVHTGESKITNADDYLFYTYDGVNYLVGYVGDETELVLPESYNGESYEIYNYAFYGCDSLVSIIIPDSVTSIGNFAFASCDSLTIYCEAESQPDGWNKYWNVDNCPVVWGAVSQ